MTLSPSEYRPETLLVSSSHSLKCSAIFHIIGSVSLPITAKNHTFLCIKPKEVLQFASNEVSVHLWYLEKCLATCSTGVSVLQLHPKECLPIWHPGNLCSPSHLLRVCYFVTPIEVSAHQLHLMECLDFLTSEVSVTLHNVFSNRLHSRIFLSHSTHIIILSSLLHLEITSPSVASKVNVYFCVGMSIHPLHLSDWSSVQLFAFVVFQKRVLCRD